MNLAAHFLEPKNSELKDEPYKNIQNELWRNESGKAYKRDPFKQSIIFI